MADIRTLHWYESAADNQAITANGWRFQVAKSVATGNGAPIYNVVWQSQGVAPVTDISWKAQYALNWTAALISPGVKVNVGGRWQRCNKGETYDLNPQGYWVPSATPAGPDGAGWLNIGNIDYAYPHVLGIHIIVGVLNNQTGRYEPIFVDQATLPQGSSAKYQPQESVSWWLEGSDLTGQVFSDTKSNATTFDFTNPSNPLTDSYEWSTSYIMRQGQWVIAAGPVPQAFRAPPPSENRVNPLGGKDPILLDLDVGSWIVRFNPPLLGGAMGVAVTALSENLKQQFKGLEVQAVGSEGTALTIQYEAGSAPGALEHIGFPRGSPGSQSTIDSALRELQTAGELPQTEEWLIEPAPVEETNGSAPIQVRKSKLNGASTHTNTNNNSNSNNSGLAYRYGPAPTDQNPNNFAANYQTKSPFLQQGYPSNPIST
ncbi:hypothetical protein QC764_214135 [Podospora pseudoanserina]|uniref:Minor tail protein n=1 Tax=Podospora pseudoanserina TaxID=2609844 RepID=A0ABR0IJA9_9PEZI|nr:hypothetical protein QC764_214135 [Podospora pseudoanserina]